MASPGSRRLRGRDSLKDHHVAAPRQRGSQLPGQRVPGTSVSHETGGCWGRGGTEEGDALPAAQGYLGTSSTWTAARSVAGGAPPADGAQELRRSQCARHPTALGQGRSSPGAHTAEQWLPSLLLPPCGVPLPFGLQNPLTRNPSLPGESEVRETLGGPPPRCCHPAAQTSSLVLALGSSSSAAEPLSRKCSQLPGNGR